MYYLMKIKDTVRVPPKEFGENLKESLLKVVRDEYEGLIDQDTGMVLAVLELTDVGEGKVIAGEASAYYEAEFKALTYKPQNHEIVEGNITEITEFGAFVRSGPIEGLMHVSQLMDDYINYDSKNNSFIGKQTKKRISVEDNVIARIVTISLKPSLNKSRIGLTMRQPGLGKTAWKNKTRTEEPKPGKETIPEEEKIPEKPVKTEKEEKGEKTEKKKETKAAKVPAAEAKGKKSLADILEEEKGVKKE